MQRSVGLFLLFFAVGACRTGGGPSTNPAPSTEPTLPQEPPTLSAPAASAKAIRGKPKTDKELPTTSGAIAMTNLEGQISELTKSIEHEPKQVILIGQLANARYLHGDIRGDLDEIDESIKLVTKKIGLEPTNPEHYIERALRQQALHRFNESRADLEQAKKLGAKPDAAASVQAELDWNLGNYEPAIVQFRAARQKKATTGTWTREGIVDLELGNNDAADRAFEEAEDSLSDTSPFPLAKLELVRGIHKQRTGRLEAAVAFFRDALRRVPAHVAAAEHLAETLHFLGQDEESIAIYEDVTKRSTDPELMGKLARLYRAKGKTKEAEQLTAKATARYRELLKKYPEAMYWHAGEYFLEDGGDPKEALDLLKKNVALRPNADSYLGLAKAELANGLIADAKASITHALASPVESAEKFHVGAAVYKKSGDEKKARTLLKRATLLNPQIEKMSGALN